MDVVTSGTVALSGKLFDATGALLATEDGTNLLISESLPAGRYFLRIGSGSSPGGGYTVSVALLP